MSECTNTVVRTTSVVLLHAAGSDGRPPFRPRNDPLPNLPLDQAAESEALVTVTSPSSSRAAAPGRASASGPAPYRTLLVGSAPVVGDEALATALAASLAQRTGHGVDVESVRAQPLADAASDSVLAGRDLTRIDAVVVVLDAERSRTGSSADAVRGLVAGLAQRLAAGSALVVVVPPPFVLGLTPRRIDELAATARAHTDALTPVVVLDDDAPGTSGDARAARWAAAIADAAAAALIDPMVRFVPDDHYDEDLRLDAIDRLPPRDGLWVAQFQQIVEAARAGYGTEAAALSIVDTDHARYGVTVGFANKVIRRNQTICNRVLRTYGGLIVGDAQLDLRFQRNPDVRSGDVRFYAGYRIESEDGAPLGSLCVFDPAPRDGVGEQDLVALRDLAVEAQQRLWMFQRAVAS